MRKIVKILSVVLMFLVAGLQAQDLPEGSKNIVNYKKLQFAQYEKEGGTITAEKGNYPKQTLLTVETTEQPKFIYSLSSKVPLYKKKVEKGQIVLLSFEAKTEFANLETGEARVLWVLNTSADPKEKIFNIMSLGSEWNQYFLPIEIDKNIRPKDLKLTMQFGFPPQRFLMKKLEFRIFPKGTKIEDLPRTKITYPGMHPDAVWRLTAAERIEKHRKGDFEIQFSKDGKPLENLKVQMDLKRHHFPFGAAVNAKKILKDEAQIENISKAFNLVVFENDLKNKAWGKRMPKESVLEAIDMLHEEEIDVKGHVLIWPGFRHLKPEFKKCRDNPKKLISMTENHVKDILKMTKGKIRSWDVTNETYTNRDLQKLTGSEDILLEGFRQAKKIDSKALRFTNEYGIISKGGLDKKKQEWYFDYVKRMDEKTGGLVDGIGIQSHIGSDLTPPEKVLDILDYYGQLEKQISISEFTMDVKDPEVRKQYTRDFMTAAFSHPSVSEFLFWGIQGEKADIFTPDWERGVMGAAFFELVHDEWTTNVVEETDSEGRVASRGFFGTYEVTFVDGDRVVKKEFEVLPGAEELIKIRF